MTEEQERYLAIGEKAYKFIRSLGWTSEQLALLYELFCELGLQYDLTETPNSAARSNAEPTPDPTPKPELMPETVETPDTAALKKEARVTANALREKDGKACRSLIKQYGGKTVDTIPVDKLPEFITTAKEMTK